MNGMNASTGARIDGNDHLAQSVADILSTPLGSRVMRRDYGSMLFDLIDQPLNPATRLLFFGATAMALSRWEPRLRLRRVGISPGDAQGQLTITIQGERADLPANDHVLLSIPIRVGGIATAN